MGRGSRGRGRGSVGDHPEDEEDFYEEEMEVSSSPAPEEWRQGTWEVDGHFLGAAYTDHSGREGVGQQGCVSTFISYFEIEETFMQFKIEKVPKL